MSPSAHAYLSASAAARWMGCPGSARLAAKLPDTASPASEEGTIAHAMAEDLLHGKDVAGTFEHAKEFYDAHPVLGTPKEMLSYIEGYRDFVLEEFNAIKAKDPHAVLLIEQHVDFSKYVPDGFGTSDVVIIGDNLMTIIDLKYGRGIRVEAQNNPQLKLYALGAVETFSMVYDFKDVRAIIYQPRLDSISDMSTDVDELRAWGADTVTPAATEAMKPDAPCVPGPWCDDHFCPAAARCSARAAHYLQLERENYAEPDLMEPEDIGEVLRIGAGLEKWLKQVSEFALHSILDGKAIPGFKVVEGRSTRVYTNQDAVAATLVKAGYDEALIYERKLLGLSKMEQLLGKKAFRETLGNLIDKPQGAPTLVPDTDKRPAFVPGTTDFDD